MRFWKMNGAGNDFIVLNNLTERLPAEVFPQLARVLCERHLSIGADGLMVVDAPTQGGDYRMRFFNSDGSVYIYGVLVYDRFRGRGMGRRLLELLLSGLRAQGAERAVLEVFSENLPAVRLYESLGFSIKEKIDYAVL